MIWHFPYCPSCELRRQAVGEIQVDASLRSPAEQRRVEKLIERLSELTPYELARYCEIVLSIHLDGIEVRPERRAKART